MRWSSLQDSLRLGLMFALGVGRTRGGPGSGPRRRFAPSRVCPQQRTGRQQADRAGSRRTRRDLAFGHGPDGGSRDRWRTGQSGALDPRRGATLAPCRQRGRPYDHDVPSPQARSRGRPGRRFGRASTDQPDDEGRYALRAEQRAAAQDVDQVTGFRIDEESRRLTLLPGSTRGLSGDNVGPGPGELRRRRQGPGRDREEHQHDRHLPGRSGRIRRGSPGPTFFRDDAFRIRDPRGRPVDRFRGFRRGPGGERRLVVPGRSRHRHDPGDQSLGRRRCKARPAGSR